MASPIRIKDISRTVTTAAANEYLAVDGPNGSGKMLTPDPRGAAAAAVAGGYGSAPIYTTAQLLALTAGNRPPVAYCSDCLVPEGVGSPVVWNGAAWISTCSGRAATTDLLTYFRGCAMAGVQYTNPNGRYLPTAPKPVGWSAAVGTGAGANALYDGQSVEYSTGTTNTGLVVSSSGFTLGISIAGAVDGSTPVVAAYLSERIYIPTASSDAEGFAVKVGFPGWSGGVALNASEISFVYDPQNSLGIGNTGKSAELFALTRASSVNTVTATGVAVGATYATAVALEVLISSGSARFFINGTEISVPQTNIPTVQLTPMIGILKNVGTTSRRLRALGGAIVLRY